MKAQLARVGTSGPRAIGIDEIAIRKGHTYRIVVVVAAPTELPIGIVTAAVGAPFFLVLLLRHRALIGP